MAHSTEQQMSSRAAVGLRSERGPILLSVMLSVGLIAIDATILATAVPSIVNDLGGFAHFPWLFSIYLLAQAVSVSASSCWARSCAASPGACRR
jgi:MFS family permease